MENKKIMIGGFKTFLILFLIYISGYLYATDYISVDTRAKIYFYDKKINLLLNEGYIDKNDAAFLRKHIGVESADFTGFHPDMILLSDFFDDDFLAGLKEGASNGNVRMMYYLSIYYLSNSKDCDKGLYWLKKTKEKGLVKSFFRYGLLYEEGLCGFSKSVTKAIDYYEIGLVHLDPESSHRLSILARKGRYTPKLNATANDLNYMPSVYGLPIAQYLRGVEFFGENKQTTDSSYAWLLISYVQGILDSMEPLKKIKYSAAFHELDKHKIHNVIKQFGRSKYSQFSYVDAFDGLEFRNKKMERDFKKFVSEPRQIENNKTVP